MKTGKQVLVGVALLMSFLTTIIGCKKGDDVNDEKPQVVEGLVTAAGTSKGPVVTKQIGAAGGSITSADQQITITIPAGALSANTTIGVEPITNTNIAGIGTAYRLTPHGQTFEKPVSITFSWAHHADSIGLLQTLGLAYQMNDGIWKFVGANNFDKNGQTITFNTTHFSDWSLMNYVSLAPYQADLQPGEKVTIAALMFVEGPQEDLIAPLTLDPNAGKYNESGYPVGNPVPLPGRYIKQWRLSGVGKITNQSSSVVSYEAPGSVNSYTTAAVSLELNAPPENAGQYLLVSNINIMGGSFVELSVGGGTPVTFPATPVVKMGDRYMLANPEDEGGGYFLLAWTGGTGQHAFDLSNTGTYVHFLTNQTGYVSRYVDEVQQALLPSGGSVNVVRLSNGWAEGTFNVTDAGYGDFLTSKTTLKGKFKVELAQK
jgi:hypothetical protein